VMAPSRKRSVNKRYSNIDEVSPNKNAAEIANKSRPRVSFLLLLFCLFCRRFKLLL
jgi:hypothetical protein